MPRALRIQYAGAVYHVMCRGDRREAIFFDDQDREMFLATLAEVCGRTGMRVHSDVLMSNHDHLLLEMPEPNLVAGMKWFQGTDTQRCHARPRLGGHFFQGRYKAIPIEVEQAGYLCAVSEYIHLNPVGARLLAGPRPDLREYAGKACRRLCRWLRVVRLRRRAPPLTMTRYCVRCRRPDRDGSLILALAAGIEHS